MQTKDLHYSSKICFYEEYFPSLDGFLEQILQTANAPEGQGNFHTDERKTPNSSWNGNISYQEAVEFAINGWPEGASKLEKNLSFVKKFTHKVTLPERSFAIAGFVPDVPLAISGELENMFSVEPSGYAAKPTLRLYSELWASCSNSAIALFNRGLALASYVDYFESNDIRVELINRNGSSNTKGKGLVQDVIIKRAEEPLNLEALAFHVTHPASLRRIVFSNYGFVPGMAPIGSYCGTPQIGALRALPDEGLLIPSANEGGKNWDTPEGACEYMRRIIISELRKRPDMRWEILEQLLGMDLSEDLAPAEPAQGAY